MIAFDESKNVHFRIQPNQVERKVNIDFNKQYDNILIDLITQKGQLLSRAQFNNTDQVDFELSDCFPGFYSLRLNTDREHRSLDLIISD